MPLASSCSMRWKRRSEPLRPTRTEIAGCLVSKPLATFSATGKSTDVYQTTFPSFSAAAIRAGPVAVAGTVSANETRGVNEPCRAPPTPSRTFCVEVGCAFVASMRSDNLTSGRSAFDAFLAHITPLSSRAVGLLRAAIFSGHDAVYGEVEDMEVLQAASCSPRRISFVQRIVQYEWDATLGDATMCSQRMAVESGKVVCGRGCADAGVGITNDHNVAFTIDRQIESTSGGGLVVNGFDTRKLSGELHHGFGCCTIVTIDAHEAAERAMMSYEIIGDRADHRG